MSRRFTEGTRHDRFVAAVTNELAVVRNLRAALRSRTFVLLSVCVVLLMFGTSVVADDELIFELATETDGPAPAPAIFVAFDDPAVGDAPVEPDVPEEADLPLDESLLTPPQAMPAAPDVDEGFSFWRRPAPSFPLPSRSFSLFQSPASYGWDYFERCCPTPFKPRGNGIPKRTSCYRMDYRPYTLRHDESMHGPAFYQRYELYPCEECNHHRKQLQSYYGLRN